MHETEWAQGWVGPCGRWAAGGPVGWRGRRWRQDNPRREQRWRGAGPDFGPAAAGTRRGQIVPPAALQATQSRCITLGAD